MPFDPRVNRRQASSLLLALTAAAVTAACGGGGGAAGTAASDATAYAAGPITGFGSVIVNGVRYDDSGAEVLDDDDGPHGRDRLRLGMMVEIDGAAVDRRLAVGRALRIRFGSEIVGPASDVDPVGGTLRVLGQDVVVTDTTVFDDGIVGGLAGVAAGDVLEVYALYDPALVRYRATRIEREDDARFFKLRGVVADHDPTALTFTLGGQVINYASVPGAEGRDLLANGVGVRVLLRTTPVAGQWTAVRLRRALRPVSDRPEADLRGTVTAFTSVTAFEVNGLPVDATNARFPDGTAGLVIGAAVKVEGAVVGGVLVASKVELDARRGEEAKRFELHGAIGDLQPLAQTFVLRGVTVSYAGAVQFKDGGLADLANGRRVEVKGLLSADRTRLVAAVIEFE